MNHYATTTKGATRRLQQPNQLFSAVVSCLHMTSSLVGICNIAITSVAVSTIIVVECIKLHHNKTVFSVAKRNSFIIRTFVQYTYRLEY